MKQSYNIEVAGVNLNIVSSDGAEFVEKTVAELEESVKKMLIMGKNYSKLDALILCALDYLGEYHKAVAKIKNLEAQVEILEADRHSKGSSALNDTVTERKTEKSEKPEKTEKNEKAERAKSEKSPSAKADAPSETSVKEENTDAADESSRDAKFRQLEAFLGSQLKMDLDKNNQ